MISGCLHPTQVHWLLMIANIAGPSLVTTPFLLAY